MNIRRMVLDVDKAVARPSVMQIAKAIEESPNVGGVNVTVTEIDIETVGMEVTIDGQNLDYDQIVKAYRGNWSGRSQCGRDGFSLRPDIANSGVKLVHAERQLNLTSHGRFASSRLGCEVLREAAEAAALSSLSSFLGALTPLIVAVIYPNDVGQRSRLHS
jgi:hypothetical protein